MYKSCMRRIHSGVKSFLLCRTLVHPYEKMIWEQSSDETDYCVVSWPHLKYKAFKIHTTLKRYIQFSDLIISSNLFVCLCTQIVYMICMNSVNPRPSMSFKYNWDACLGFIVVASNCLGNHVSLWLVCLFIHPNRPTSQNQMAMKFNRIHSVSPLLCNTWKLDIMFWLKFNFRTLNKNSKNEIIYHKHNNVIEMVI